MGQVNVDLNVIVFQLKLFELGDCLKKEANDWLRSFYPLFSSFILGRFIMRRASSR